MVAASLLRSVLEQYVPQRRHSVDAWCLWGEDAVVHLPLQGPQRRLRGLGPCLLCVDLGLPLLEGAPHFLELCVALVELLFRLRLRLLELLFRIRLCLPEQPFGLRLRLLQLCCMAL